MAEALIGGMLACITGMTLSQSALLGILTLGGTVAQAAPAPDAASPACVRSSPEVRYGNAGYDHVVRLVNTCRATASCDVSTDVNPELIRVRVPSGSEQEVVTMRGSPARQFTPNVVCHFKA